MSCCVLACFWHALLHSTHQIELDSVLPPQQNYAEALIFNSLDNDLQLNLERMEKACPITVKMNL